MRDKKSGICRPRTDPFHTAGSWVSVLSPLDSECPPCHWVTSTPDPSISLFKPFIFSLDQVISDDTVSPLFENDPVKKLPWFQFKVDKRHTLYKLHQSVSTKGLLPLTTLHNTEKSLKNTDSILRSLKEGKQDISCCDRLFKNALEVEIELYLS